MVLKMFPSAGHDSDLIAFVEIILGLTTMSYGQLGYDKDNFADPSVHCCGHRFLHCQQE